MATMEPTQYCDASGDVPELRVMIYDTGAYVAYL